MLQSASMTLSPIKKSKKSFKNVHLFAKHKNDKQNFGFNDEWNFFQLAFFEYL